MIDPFHRRERELEILLDSYPNAYPNKDTVNKIQSTTSQSFSITMQKIIIKNNIKFT